MGTSGPSKSQNFSKNLEIEKNIEINTFSTKKEDNGKINISSVNNEDNKQKNNMKELIEKLLATLNKEKCKKIVSSFPSKQKTDFQKFKSTLQSKTEKLTEIEKAYIIFVWMANNIEYNIGLKGNITHELCEPINVYKTGKAVCAGYSNLYKDFADC